MNVRTSQPAEIALSNFGPEDRQRVLAWFNHLQHWLNDEFLQSRAICLDADEQLYVLQTNSDPRIIFRVDAEEIVVLDVVWQDTIDLFASESRTGQNEIVS